MSKLDPFLVAQAIKRLDEAQRLADEATEAQGKALQDFQSAREELRHVLGVPWGQEFSTAIQIARGLLP